MFASSPFDDFYQDVAVAEARLAVTGQLFSCQRGELFFGDVAPFAWSRRHLAYLLMTVHPRVCGEHEARKIPRTDDGLSGCGTGIISIAGVLSPSEPAGVSSAGVVAIVEPPKEVQPALGGLLIAPLASHDNLSVDEVTVTVASGAEGLAGVSAGVQQPQAALPVRLRPPDVVRRAHRDGGNQDTDGEH